MVYYISAGSLPSRINFSIQISSEEIGKTDEPDPLSPVEPDHWKPG